MMPTYEELAAQNAALIQAISEVRSTGKPTGFGVQSPESVRKERLAWMKLNEAAQLAPAACLAQVKADAFGDGYYDGFIDGAKHQDDVDLNTKSSGGIAKIKDEAMRCSEIAENQYAERIRQGDIK